MNKRRLILVCFLVLAMSMSFFAVACNGGKNPTETTVGTKAESTETTGTEATTAAPSQSDTTESDTDDGLPEADSVLSLEQAIALGKTMQSNQYTEAKYYITGKVKLVYNKSTGNMSIADEKGNSIIVNGAYNKDGTVKYGDMTEKPVAGDVVTVYGAIGQYNGSARINEAWITEFNSATSDTTNSVGGDTTETTQGGDTTVVGTGSETTEAPDASETTQGTDVSETTESEETTTAPIVDDSMYGNGDPLSYAGIDWESGFFANVKHDIDESKAQSISALDLLAKMVNRNGEDALKAGEVWIVTEPIVLESGKSYYGNGAAIIAQGGILIRDAVDVVLKDVLVKGCIKIEKSHELSFYKLDIVSSDVTVDIDADSSDIAFKTCRIYGKWASVKSLADDLTIYRCYVRANHALQLKGDNIIVQDCKMFASEGAITVCGDDNSVRENTITVLSSGFGVVVEKGSKNALVALNDIRGAQNSITVNGGYNCSVTLNRAIIITGTANTNLYVVDNNVGGYLHLENNDYLIADKNTYPKDNRVHTVVDLNNNNKNGDAVTDLDARPDAGVNYDILPHTNKDLFVGMARKSLVADASFTMSKGLGGYIKECAKNDGVVVVAPGAYSSGSIVFNAETTNVKVYAYGVYQEYSETNYANFVSKQLDFDHTSNVEVYGLTMGYAIPSSGQVRVVEKFKTEAGKYAIKVIADAGFWDGITTTDTDLFNTTWLQVCLVDDQGNVINQVDENLKGKHLAEKNYDENGNYDGTMTITIFGRASNANDATNMYGEDKSAVSIWNRIEKGTVLTCRLAGGNRRSIYILNSQNLTLCDLTLYGYTAAFSAYANGVSSNINFIRYNDATQSNTLIDKDTYDKYVALEEKWGVDFQVYEETLEDGTVRYRGAQPMCSSVDGLHAGSTVTGVNFNSCIVENMVDDGMNQHSNPSRLHDIVDNGDGTATIYYKGTVSDSTFGSTDPGGTMTTGACPNFGTVGSVIYIYTPDGREVCRAKTIETFAQADAAHRVKEEDTIITVDGKTCYVYPTVFMVKVKSTDINWDVIKNPETGEFYYDLAYNGWDPKNLVVVDNASQCSGGYTVDNMLIRNNGSRGILVKSWDVTIKHCTFLNISLNGIYINPEVYWGESTMAKNIVIQQCEFKNTGFMYNNINDENFACIRIGATTEYNKPQNGCISKSADANALPIENITITGCKFTNNRQRIAIWVDSAKDVKITNNTFDDCIYDVLPQAKGIAVFLGVCRNVEISDNTYNYAHYNGSITNVIIAPNLHAQIHGTDVTAEDGTPIFADKLAQ